MFIKKGIILNSSRIKWGQNKLWVPTPYKLNKENIIVYFDTQAENFRSFNLNNIVSITNLSRTPLEINKKEKEKIEREKKKGYNCLRCNTTLQTDYRNKFDSNYCGDC